MKIRVGLSQAIQAALIKPGFFSRNLTTLWIIIGIFTATSPLLLSQNESEIFAFVNVTLVPMNEEGVRKNATVVVHKGKILDVGPTRKVQIPESATRIDGRGLYLIPGLSDMHVHLGNESDMKLYLANGITTVRNMRGSPIHLVWRSKMASGEMIGPRIITAGPILDGAPPSGENVVSVASPEEGRAWVEQQKKAGYDFIKTYTRLTVPVYREIMRAAKENGMQVAGHVPTAVGLDMVLSEQQNSIEHLTGYISALKVHDLTSRTDVKQEVDIDQIPLLANETREHRVWNCVTLIVQQRYASVNEADSLRKLPEMKYVSPIRMALWDPSKDPYFKSMSQEDYGSAQEGIQVLKTITRTLEDHGAKILLGTDSPSRFVVPGFSAHEELQNLVNSGLTPYEALSGATVNAAEFLNQSEEFGTIEKGKSADLVLLRANPLENIRNTRQISGVMVRGTWIPETRIREMLAEVLNSFQPRENRFANVPEPSVDGTPIFSARYEYSYGGVQLGEERLKVYSLAENQEKIVAQQVLDSPSPSIYTVETTHLINDYTKKSILFRSERPEGRGELSIEQNDGSIRVDGKLPYMADINYIAAGQQNKIFGVTEISSRFLLNDALNKLKVGDSTSLSFLELDPGEIFAKGFTLLPTTWSVVRKPDSEVSIGESRIPVTNYRLEITTKYGVFPGILVLDKEGFPVRWTKGLWQYKRVQ